MAEVFERLKGVVVAELGVPEEKIVAEASFRDDLGASSQKIFDLILAIEDEFQIEVPDEDAMSITTIADAVSYLEEHSG